MALKVTKSRTIVLPLTESIYSDFMQDNNYAHALIQASYAQHPGLFPSEMSGGYKLNGRTSVSKKLGYALRRIRIAGVSYQLRPSFVLPYMRAKTSEVEDALFLLRFGVPFWALAQVFGRYPMFWYRCFICLSNFSIVGTTVYAPECLPEDLLADEFHTRTKGQKTYIATTISQGCFLGLEATSAADAPALTDAYGIFKAEALNLKPDYQPHSVNTDGWQATQKAWKTLFSLIAVVECFLHAFIKIRDRATKKLQASFNLAADKVWEIYRAESKSHMAQRIRRLAQWAKENLKDSPMKENILKLCKKRKRWLAHFDFPAAYRTSSQLDRLMRAMERHAINSQMFHANLKSTTKNFRAFALLYNFSPSSPTVCKKCPQLQSPAARLNEKVLHQNWLQNLLLAASLKGYRQQQNPV